MLLSLSCWLLPPTLSVVVSFILTICFSKATAQARPRLTNKVVLVADPLGVREPPSEWFLVTVAGAGDRKKVKPPCHPGSELKWSALTKNSFGVVEYLLCISICTYFNVVKCPPTQQPEESSIKFPCCCYFEIDQPLCWCILKWQV